MKIEPPRASRLSLQESRESTASSGQRWLLNETGGRGAQVSLAALNVGQEISALVIEQLADGHIILDLGGSLVEANDPGGVIPGQTLRLRVDLTEPQVMLHIIEQKLSLAGELTKLMRRYLPGDDGVSLAILSENLAATASFDDFGTPMRLDKLKMLLADLFQKREPFTPDRLVQFVRDGGLHYEMKLSKAAAEDAGQLMRIADGDLKGLLLGALDELNKVESHSDLRKIIAGQLHCIEGQQVANLLAQVEDHGVQLQIPLLTGNVFSTAALAVKPDGRTKSGPEERRRNGYTILFIFDLKVFGRTRINAHLRDRDLSVTFYIERETSLTHLRGELAGLRELLHALGYRDVLLGARRWCEVTIEQQRAFNALSLGVPSEVNLVDVTV